MGTRLNLRPVLYDDVKKLRQLYDLLEFHVRNLSAFDISTKNYGPILNSIIIAKQMSTGKWDISKLLDIFKHEIVSRERCEQFRGTPINESKNNLEFSSTMYVNSASSFSGIYCNKPHAPNRCDVITNVIARKNILREKKRLYVCLKGGHNSNNCFSKYLCFKCNKGHHVSICDQRSNRDEELASQDIGKQQVTVERTNHTLMISVHNNTLLQTAIAKISNLNGANCSHKVRLLFDNCSQKSFIKTKLSVRLNLQIIRTERLAVKTFASVEATIQDLNVVNFKVTSKNGMNSVNLEAYAVPTICAPVANQTLKLATDKHPWLRNMYFADYDLECAEKEIDILVGANHYWSFTSDRITRIENQLVDLDTIFGRMLSGSFQPLHQIPSDSVNVLSTHVLEISSETFFIPDDKLEKFWSVESVISNIPIKSTPQNLLTKFGLMVKDTPYRYYGNQIMNCYLIIIQIVLNASKRYSLVVEIPQNCSKIMIKKLNSKK